MSTVYTVGHSTHSLQEFLSLLHGQSIKAVADVRSAPYSRRQPQFNHDALRQALASQGIGYVPLGAQLGGRGNAHCERNEQGRILYRSITGSAQFREGLSRVESGSGRMRIAIMCTERDPLNCHRGILISRVLCADGMQVLHICGNGEIEAHSAAERRLLRLTGLAQPDLFRTGEEILAEAYARQEARIAHVELETKTRPDEGDPGLLHEAWIGVPAYEESFIGLMKDRHIETSWAGQLRDCLLCSEENAVHSITAASPCAIRQAVPVSGPLRSRT